jgi:hypothetical protein
MKYILIPLLFSGLFVYVLINSHSYPSWLPYLELAITTYWLGRGVENNKWKNG